MTNPWPERTIAEVCEVVSGGTPKTGIAAYWDGPHAWITPAEMGKRASPYVDATERTLTQAGLDNSSARPLPPHSVILSTRAPIGHLVINTVPMATNQGCKGLVPGDSLDAKFLYYYLAANRERLDAMGTGATFRELSGGRLKEVRLPIPQMAEQRRIITILDEAFVAIATAKANTGKHLANARAVFASASDAILAGCAETTPRRLEEVAASDCTLSYGIVQPGEERESGLILVRPVDLGPKYIGAEGLKRIDPSLAKGYVRTRLQGNELLLCVRGTTGTVGVATDELKGGNVTRGLVPVRFDPAIVRRDFGYYLLKCDSVQSQIRAKTYGAALMQINIKDVRDLLVRVPQLPEQDRAVANLDMLEQATQRLESLAQEKLAALDALKASLLHQALTGQLQASTPVAAFSSPVHPAIAMSSTDLHAGVLAIAYRVHESANKAAEFGHVKAEKIAHMVEALLGIDLGRAPVKDAAGPNDFPHLKKVEHRARMANYFHFQRREGSGYRVTTLRGFDRIVEKTRTALGDRIAELDKLLSLMVRMDWRQAEIFATTYAAWNNLLMDGARPDDATIVLEARDRWHPDKLAISPERFHKAIKFMRDEGLVPTGKGKRVNPKVA